MNNKFEHTILILALLCVFAGVGHSQTTAFTYQGSLQSGGSPANGSYDLQFALYDVPSGGSQQGSTISMNSVTVANGIFSVSLDFGGQFSGAERYLEIQVRQAGGGAFTTLSPRQRVTSSPHSIKAQTADTAANAQQLGGVSASQFVQTNDPRLSDARDPRSGSSNYIQNGTTYQTGTFNISGNGIFGGQMMANSIYSPKALFGNLSSNTSVVAAGSNTNTAIWGYSGSDAGVRGYSSDSDGVYGNSTNSTASSSAGVHGEGSNVAFGVWGKATSAVGIKGESDTNYGVWGYSAAGGGVYGSSNSGPGVTGQSQTSDGVKGIGKRGVFGQAFGAGSRGVEAYGTSWFSGDTTPLTGTTGTGVAIGSLPSAPYAGYIFADDYNANAGQVLALNSAGGNVGIGTTTPSDPLTVKTGSSSYGVVQTDGTVTVGTYVSAGNGWLGTKSNHPLNFFVNNGAPSMSISTGGLVSITTLGSAGSTTLCRNASNQISSCSSSLRYKTNIRPFSEGLSFVSRLRPISFDWKADGTKDVGFGAEDIAKIDPRFVTYNEKGEVEGVKYDRITAVLINAVKEQQARIEALEKQNRVQQKQIDDQNTLNKKQELEIGELKALICRSHRTAAICHARK